MKRVVISQHVLSLEEGRKRDSLEQNYIQYYEQFNIALIPVPNVLSNLDSYLEAIRPDRIILSGGNDVNPKLYDGVLSQSSTHADERDKTEKDLLLYAVNNKIPVFCECRGTQFLNVFFGGRLKQVNHVVTSHTINLTFDPTCHDIASFSDTAKVCSTIPVNSYHTYGFTAADLSASLKPFAVASDGVIEGVIHSSLPILGVLWHPERQSPNKSFNEALIKAFCEGTGFWKAA